MKKTKKRAKIADLWQVVRGLFKGSTIVIVHEHSGSVHTHTIGVTYSATTNEDGTITIKPNDQKPR